MDDNIEEDDYVLMGNYHVTEANRFLGMLEAAGVRFWVEMDDSGIKNMTPMAANFGGTFGQGVQIRVYVHPDDVASFHQTHQEVFDPAPEPDPVRTSLRDRLRSIQ